MLIFEDTLEINEKWLDFRASHSAAHCKLSLQSLEGQPVEHFTCDHIIVDLYKMALQELKRHPEKDHDERSESDDVLYLRVLESLREMPITVEARTTNRAGEIEVLWADLDRDVASRVFGMEPKCQVTLHRKSTCGARRHDLLATSKWISILPYLALIFDPETPAICLSRADSGYQVQYQTATITPRIPQKRLGTGPFP